MEASWCRRKSSSSTRKSTRPSVKTDSILHGSIRMDKHAKTSAWVQSVSVTIFTRAMIIWGKMEAIKSSAKLQAANALIMCTCRLLALRISSAHVSTRIRTMMWGRRIVKIVLVRSFCRIRHALVARNTAITKPYLQETQKVVRSQFIPPKEKSPVSVVCLTELIGMKKPSSRRLKSKDSKSPFNSSRLQSPN